ncbi:hypothetical protein [Psittacicella hinzii]|nr:hypothetical protein [Psittacicella hinzii]
MTEKKELCPCGCGHYLHECGPDCTCTKESKAPGCTCGCNK